jgi:prepilin-type N-terminal cleavage/methylation domain-containing protein
MRNPHLTRASAQHGFSMVEMVVVFAIVTIAISMFARTLASAKKLDPMATETTVAASAARTILEKMKNHPFEDIFPLYNGVPADDPGGAGTGPGAQFDVEGLTPITPGAKCGTIIFPANKTTLREDVEDAMLGMPRDLNADGVIDSQNHAGDCMLLPIRIRVEWIMHGSKDTHRSFEMYTMFGRF